MKTQTETQTETEAIFYHFYCSALSAWRLKESKRMDLITNKNDFQ